MGLASSTPPPVPSIQIYTCCLRLVFSISDSSEAIRKKNIWRNFFAKAFKANLNAADGKWTL